MNTQKTESTLHAGEDVIGGTKNEVVFDKRSEKEKRSKDKCVTRQKCRGKVETLV